MRIYVILEIGLGCIMKVTGPYLQLVALCPLHTHFVLK